MTETRQASPEAPAGLETWLDELRANSAALGLLLRPDEAAQAERGYFHTLREICQQPLTWLETARRAVSHQKMLSTSLGGLRAVALTGSGSSLYAAESAAPGIRAGLSIPATSVAGGDILTNGSAALPLSRPCLLVSLARSGDSPESSGAVEYLLESEPNCRHLAITCNRDGQLAMRWKGDPRMAVLSLSDATCDRSLVMTSSYTNMVIASQFLGRIQSVPAYQDTVSALAATARHVLGTHADRLQQVARGGFTSAVYLANPVRLGGAHEAALKMLEITAGRVRTAAETFLGLRHGPMAAVHSDTLVVCFLSNDAHARAYEEDLIRELQQKRLGLCRVLVGETIPAELLSDGDVALECPGLKTTGVLYCGVIDVLVGQLLAFFRSLEEGFQPDAPSAGGVINRVVASFRVHKRQQRA